MSLTPNALPAHWPVLGVCGFQNSGKTSLLEAAIPHFVARGLRVAVVKADAHGIDVDRPGKDSDRLFRAGATVALCGPEESLQRKHTPGKAPLAPLVQQHLRKHDLVLVEGHKSAPLSKVWLHTQAPQKVPHEARDILAQLPWQPLAERVARLSAEVEALLERAAAATPRYLGLLIGGASRRMGAPKHRLVMPDGRELLEHLVERFHEQAEAVVLLGNECVAPSLAALPRLPDVLDAPRRGPLAGMLAALRFAPEARWSFAACDQPALQADGLAWLAAQQPAAGTWGVVATCEEAVQPLPCLLDGRLCDELERLLRSDAGPRRLVEHEKVRAVELPPALHAQWQDVDTPQQWQAYLRSLA